MLYTIYGIKALPCAMAHAGVGPFGSETPTLIKTLDRTGTPQSRMGRAQERMIRPLRTPPNKSPEIPLDRYWSWVYSASSIKIAREQD